MSLISSDEEKKPPKKIEKILFSILLTGVPANCTREYLAQFLRNEDIVLGIEIFANNEAEVVVASIFESVRILSQNFYF